MGKDIHSVENHIDPAREALRKDILEYYDVNKDGILEDKELDALILDYKNGKIIDPKLKKSLEKYDTNNDGSLDAHEINVMKKELHMTDGAQRYAGYSITFARLFRYLAFTSDFGEALRPVIHARIVTGTYAIAIGYCFVDVGWEAYKLQKRGYVTEKNEPMTMTQCVVERSAFQAIASVIVPAVLIHTTVDVSSKVFKRIGRFTKYGPSIVGLCFIPFLPLYLDHPVESGLEWVFEHYGPWAKKSHKD